MPGDNAKKSFAGFAFLNVEASFGKTAHDDVSSNSPTTINPTSEVDPPSSTSTFFTSNSFWLGIHSMSYLIGGVCFFFGSACYFPSVAQWLLGGWLFTIGSAGYLIADVIDWSLHNHFTYYYSKITCKPKKAHRVVRVTPSCSFDDEESPTHNEEKSMDSYPASLYGATKIKPTPKASTTAITKAVDAYKRHIQEKDKFWGFLESDINYFFSFCGSSFYLLGSILYIPSFDAIVLGTILFIPGSAFIMLAQAWKLYRMGLLSKGNEKGARSFSTMNWQKDKHSVFIEWTAGMGALVYFIGSFLFLPENYVNEQTLWHGAAWFEIGGIFFGLTSVALFYRALTHYRDPIT